MSAPKELLHLDFETRSEIDLVKCGAHVYAEHPSTEVLCAAYAFGEEPVKVWRPGEPCPARIFRFIEGGGLVVAHNAAFERAINNFVLVRRHAWPYIYVQQTICTAAMAYHMALPASLGSCAEALGATFQKDQDGRRLMMSMCKPKRYDNGVPVWVEDEESLERLIAYCVRDVETERAIEKLLLKLSPKELEIYHLDQTINDLGIQVDVDAVENALSIIEVAKNAMDEEMRALTRNEVESCRVVMQIRMYLARHEGLFTESLAKPDLAKLLERNDLSVKARQILELRQAASKVSTAKLEAMVRGASQSGRLQGTFQYSGANTRRWAGRRIQLQNLPRPKLKNSVIESVMKGLHSHELDFESIDDLVGPPLEVISNCLRGFLVAGEGFELTACDFSAIEARVIAWLANEEPVLEIFRTHGKIYEAAAQSIFGRRTLEDVSSPERQVGKVAVLALGYQGGVGAFEQMAKGYGVKMAPALEALKRSAGSDAVQFAVERYYQNINKFPELSREEFVACELTKVLWRKSNPKIVLFWNELEDAALNAVRNPGTVSSTRNGAISFKQSGDYLFCKLPSGGVITYPGPQIQCVTLPWGAKKDALTYLSEDLNRKWTRFKTYGGSLAENVTQAVARDLLADSMLRLHAQSFRIVAHVHDEVICETVPGTNALEKIAKCMETVPIWARGLPLKASGWSAPRFRK